MKHGYLFLLIFMTGCGFLNQVKDGKIGTSNKEKTSTKTITSASVTDLGFNLSIDTYESCSEIQTIVYEQESEKALNEYERQLYYQSRRFSSSNSAAKSSVAPVQHDSADMSGSANAEASGDAAADEETFTNIQEEGVDESDFPHGCHCRSTKMASLIQQSLLTQAIPGTELKEKPVDATTFGSYNKTAKS